MRRIGSAVLVVAGVLMCPCHLGLTLPLLTGLLAGTTLGSVLTQLTALVYTGAGLSFVGALALAYWCWFGPNRPNRDVSTACPTSTPEDQEAGKRARFDDVNARAL
jgi:mercuric ion transport protein